MNDTTLSLLGLYTWDNTIFDNMVLPDEIDKSDFIDNLLMETAELEVLYPDSDFIKKAIGAWSNKRIHTWNRVAQVLYEEYDPFINIKRDEVRTIIHDRDLTYTNKGDTTTNENAWDDNTSDGVQTQKVNVDLTNTDTGQTKTTETFHVEGDSAITDAQDVAIKEVKMRSQYDLYDYIINDFIHRFCIMVYQEG